MADMTDMTSADPEEQTSPLEQLASSLQQYTTPDARSAAKGVLDQYKADRNDPEQAKLLQQSSRTAEEAQAILRQARARLSGEQYPGNKWLALASAINQPNPKGTFGGTMGNLAEGLYNENVKQEKWKTGQEDDIQKLDEMINASKQGNINQQLQALFKRNELDAKGLGPALRVLGMKTGTGSGSPSDKGRFHYIQLPDEDNPTKMRSWKTDSTGVNPPEDMGILGGAKPGKGGGLPISKTELASLDKDITTTQNAVNSIQEAIKALPDAVGIWNGLGREAGHLVNVAANVAGADVDVHPDLSEAIKKMQAANQLAIPAWRVTARGSSAEVKDINKILPTPGKWFTSPKETENQYTAVLEPLQGKLNLLLQQRAQALKQTTGQAPAPATEGDVSNIDTGAIGKSPSGVGMVFPKGTAIPKTNSNGWTLHKDSKGRMAYVGPNNEVQMVTVK